MQRRQFIGSVVGLALPLAGQPASGSRVGTTDLARLHRDTARLRRLDNVLGGADTYQLYKSRVEATGLLLNDGIYTEEVGRGLRSLLGEHHQIAGWAAFDAGYQVQARKHYMASFAAAREAQDNALAGNALAFVAYQEIATEKDGTANAQASYATAAAVATPRVAALLLERKAFAFAVAGDAKQADVALGQACETLDRRDDRHEPDWAFWVDEEEIKIMSGRCWTELRRPLRAVPVLESVLAAFEDTHGRDKALYLTWLVEAYLQAREVEQAGRTLVRAHRLCAGVGSVRPAARVAGLARNLKRYRKVSEVGSALDEIGI